MRNRPGRQRRLTDPSALARVLEDGEIEAAGHPDRQAAHPARIRHCLLGG